jgi:hypothetical protein
MGATWLVEAGWRLWRAGVAGAVGLALLIGAVAQGVEGGLAVGAVGLGAATSLGFFTVGHVAQVLCARVDARLLLVATLTTFLVQVVALTVALDVLGAAGWPPRWVFGGVVAGVAGWVGGLLATYRRLRVPVFDPPPETPGQFGMTSSSSPDRLHGDERSEEQRW